MHNIKEIILNSLETQDTIVSKDIGIPISFPVQHTNIWKQEGKKLDMCVFTLLRKTCFSIQWQWHQTKTPGPAKSDVAALDSTLPSLLGVCVSQGYKQCTNVPGISSSWPEVGPLLCISRFASCYWHWYHVRGQALRGRRRRQKWTLPNCDISVSSKGRPTVTSPPMYMPWPAHMGQLKRHDWPRMSCLCEIVAWRSHSGHPTDAEQQSQASCSSSVHLGYPSLASQITSLSGPAPARLA